MKFKNQENSKNDQNPEFSKNPKNSKKRSIFSENTGVPPVFSTFFWIFLDFLKIQVFDHFLNFLDFWVSWPVAGNYFLTIMAEFWIFRKIFERTLNHPQTISERPSNDAQQPPNDNERTGPERTPDDPRTNPERPPGAQNFSGKFSRATVYIHRDIHVYNCS